MQYPKSANIFESKTFENLLSIIFFFFLQMNNYVENNYSKIIFTLNIMSIYEKIFNTTLKTCLKLFENNFLRVNIV